MIKDDQTLAAGVVVRATFHANTKPESGYRLRATHVSGSRAPKAVRPSRPGVLRHPSQEGDSVEFTHAV